MSLSREQKRMVRLRIAAELRNLEERAASGEIVAPAEYAKVRAGYRELENSNKLPADAIKLAEQNGITYDLMKKRVYKNDIDPYVAAAMQANTKRGGRVSHETSGITPEKYIEYKKMRIADPFIQEEFNLSSTELLKFKKLHELDMKHIKGKYRKPERPKKKIKHRISQETLRLAEKNGIKLNTLKTRIHTHNWPHRRAATEKPKNVRDIPNSKPNVYDAKSVYTGVSKTGSGNFKSRISINGIQYYGPTRTCEIKSAEDADMIKVEHNVRLHSLNFPEKLSAYHMRLSLGKENTKEGVGAQ